MSSKVDDTLRRREEKRKAFLKEAKKHQEIVGFEIRVYQNRPHKVVKGLVKLIKVMHNPLRGQTARQLIAQNVPTAEAMKLVNETDKKKLKEIDDLHKKHPNYGLTSINRGRDKKWHTKAGILTAKPS